MPCTGKFKLEVWGGQGGSGGSQYASSDGGPGGYSTGIYAGNINTILYVVIGGQGSYWTSDKNYGGYNGGGYSNTSGSGGGGATHMALVSGTLSSIGIAQISKILIVAGAGGGWDGGMSSYDGSGGGYIGNDPNNGRKTNTITGGSQTGPGITPGFTNDAGFGQGFQTTSINNTNGGGGSGLYGGGSSAGGSGYIGNPLLISYGSVTKHMAGYNLANTSTTDNARTSSTTCVSATATADCAKSGHGAARITIIE